jgi:ankyrin repeat protein
VTASQVLVSSRPIAPAEEVTWWYKRAYRRDGYRAQPPPGQPRHCALGDNVRVARTLLAAGADVHAPNGRGGTALHEACGQNDVEMARMLLTEAAAAVDAPGRAHATSLHVAASRGHAEVAALLIEHGADVAAQLEDGTHSSALHLCAAEGGVRVVTAMLRALSAHGAPAASAAALDALDANGRTPLRLAEASGHARVAKLLRSHAASRVPPASTTERSVTYLSS